MVFGNFRSIVLSPGFRSFHREISCYSDKFTFICDLGPLSWILQHPFYSVYLSFKYNYAWGVSILALSIWYFCASYIWMSITFLHFRKFSSMILLKNWSMPLTWNYSSSMSIKVPGYSFTELKKKVSAFEKPDSSSLTSSSDILSSSWLILLVWIYSKVFYWLAEFFISIFVSTWIFFNPVSLMSSLFIFLMSEVSGQAEGQSQGA